MKKLLSILNFGILLMVALSISSCGDDLIKFEALAIDGEINTLFDKIQTIHKNETVIGAKGKEIRTEGGISINIPPNAYMNDQNEVIEGEVEIIYIEVNHPSIHIIYNALSNVGDLPNYMIDTERQIFIQAFANEERLNYADGKSIAINMATEESEDPIIYFTGDDIEELVHWKTSGQVLDYTDWETYDSVSMETIQESGYKFSTTSEQTPWHQIGRGISFKEEELTPVHVILPDELFSGKNTYVYAVFEDYNAVLPLKSVNGTAEFKAEFGLPKSLKVNFVALSVHGDNDYSLDIKENYISNNHLEFLVPERTPLTTILDELGKF